MKKNTMMRLASFLLIAVLITTSAISGTYAKYVTQDSASDSARVAKWGISLQAIGNLYGKSYDDKIVADNDSNLAVQVANVATATENVVAPGTKNEEGLSFALTGTPEVDYQIDATIKSQNIYLKTNAYGQMVKVQNPTTGKTITAENFDGLKDELYIYNETDANNKKYVSVANSTYDTSATYYTLEDYVNLSTDYYPVVYSMSGSTAETTGTISSDSLNTIAGKIATQLNGATVTGVTAGGVTTYTVSAKKYESNTPLVGDNNINLDDQRITWKWDFCQNTTDCQAGNDACEHCKADTILGLLESTDTDAAVVKKSGNDYVALTEYTDYCLDTQFDINITVTQVD